MKVLLWILLFTTLYANGQSDRRNIRNKGADVSKSVIAAYKAKSFHGMPYRILLPDNYDESVRYPVILSLHGRAGIGDDNISQLRSWNAKFVSPAWQKKYPCIVIVPQSWDSWSAFNERSPGQENKKTWQSPSWEKYFDVNGGYSWEQNSTGSLTLAFLLLDEITRRYSVNENRIYVLGHSAGGFGSWNAIWHAPERFAAAITSAGGLLPWKDPVRFKDVPIWAFHGNADPVVPVDFTREIFNKMKSIKGNMKYTELGGVKHRAGVHAFKYKGDDSNKKFITQCSSNRCDRTKDIWEWLFKQSR